MSEDNNILNQNDIDSLLAAEDKEVEGGSAPATEPVTEVESPAVDAEQDMDEAIPETEAEEQAVEDELEALSAEVPAETESEAVEDTYEKEESDAIIASTPPAENFAAGNTGTGTYHRDIDFIMDIPLQLRVEVGRTKVSIASLLSYGPGAVVELEKLAGEPLDIFVNDKLVARGEAIVVNDKFGVRLTDVVSKSERIENLS